MNIHEIYLISPLAIVFLAIASVVSSFYKKRWENIVPRLVILGVYLYATVYPDWAQDERQFFVRWSLALLLGVEAIFGVSEKYYYWRRKNGK